MNFKAGDRVLSVRNNEATDQVGIVLEVTDKDVIVSPVDFPGAIFSYDLNGNHREDLRFSIKKVEGH